MKHRRAGAVLLIALLWAGLLLSPTPAYAHARLLGSSPAPGSSMETAPSQIEITLSEAVTLEFSTIVLLNRSRQEIPLGPIAYGSQGETSVSVSPKDVLPPGTYGAIWRVVSAIDGHLTTGSFVFRVLNAGDSPQTPLEPVPGASSANEATPGTLRTAEQRPGLIHWLVRALVLACITFCLGGAIFLVLVVEPAAGELGRVEEGTWAVLGARFAMLGSIAAAALVPLLALDFWAQVAAISETDLPGAVWRADLGSLLLSNTRYGFAWAMKVLSALVLFGVFMYLRVRRTPGGGLWEIGIAAGSLFLLAESLSSHAAAVVGEDVGGLPLPVISDWVHLVTASTWTGGLLFFVFVLFPTYRNLRHSQAGRRAFLGAAVPRFSRLALVSVLALGLSGTYNLAIQTTDLSAIASSLYGQVVGLKVLLFGALLLIGALNLAHLTPRLRSARAEEGAGIISSFRRNMRLEVALMAVVLLCAGGLTLLPPPSVETAAATPAPQDQRGLTLPTVPSAMPGATSTILPVPVVAATSIAGTSFAIAVEKASTADVFTLTLRTEAGTQDVLADVTRLVFTVSPQSLEAGSTALRAERAAGTADGTQVWVARAPVLALEGDYLVTAVAQRADSGDLKAAFWLTLSEGEQIAVRAIDYLEARFLTVPEPARVGLTQVVVEMRGSEGGPVSGVVVAFEASGSANRKVGATPVRMIPTGVAGQYATEVIFPSAGPWVLEVSAARAGQPDIRFTASIDVLEGTVSRP
ncbi:MAG TPA: CopD family protein [Chloroflexia bacterium]|jgi:copper transport protein